MDIVGFALWDVETANMIKWIDGGDLDVALRECQWYFDRYEVILVAEYEDDSLRQVWP
jgi:hypothetical protein